MTEAQEPKRTEAQLKALKRQVSGIAPSMYDKPPAKPEAEAESKTEAPKATSKYYNEDESKKSKTALSRTRSLKRTMRHK